MMSSTSERESKLRELQTKLGYQFSGIDLLKIALTRQKAIEDNMPGASRENSKRLEFVGDGFLRSQITVLLYKKYPEEKSTDLLTEMTKYLIGNTTVLPKIARSLNLSSLIIRGKAEPEPNDNMLADALEAVLGAAVIDKESRNYSYSSSSQEPSGIIQRLWTEKYFSEALQIARENLAKARRQSETKEETKEEKTSSSSLPRLSVPSSSTSISTSSSSSSIQSSSRQTIVQVQPGPRRSVSPRSQRMFTAVGLTSQSISKFELYVQDAKNSPSGGVNQRNVGAKGDTALMLLLRTELTPNRLEKAKTLLKHGALWTTPNNQGETADSLAQKHHQKDKISELKNMRL